MWTTSWKFAAVLSGLAVSFAAARAEAVPLTWGNNSGNLTWDTTSANWGNGTTTYNNTTPDSVIFGPVNPVAHQTITVAAGLTPAAVTFNNLHQYNMTGAGWGGSGSLTKMGTGNVVLHQPNTFTGGTFIDQGKVFVRFDQGATIGATGFQNVTVASGATLQSEGSANFSGTLTLNGGTWHAGYFATWTGPVILNDDSLIYYRHGVTIDGVVSGPGGITRQSDNGGGILTLKGINTYTGDTVLMTQRLDLNDDAGLLFDIDAAGVNNQVVGAGTIGARIANLNGDFTFDLTGAGDSLGDSWNIVDVASLTANFGPTFSVNDFSDIGGGLWEGESDLATYVFSETTGLLSVTAVAAVPEPASVTLWLLLGVSLAGFGIYRRRRA